MNRKSHAAALKRPTDVTADLVSASETSNVIDFANYRGSRCAGTPPHDANDAEEALQELAHHLMMAVQVIKKFAR